MYIVCISLRVICTNSALKTNFIAQFLIYRVKKIYIYKPVFFLKSGVVFILIRVKSGF